MTSPWTPNPALEGAPLYAYGHSYMASLSNSVQPGQRYMERVARRLSLTHVNRAVSGYQMQDAALDMLYGPRAWSVGSSGIVVIDATINDVKNFGPETQAVRGYKWSLRSALRYLSLSSALPEDSGLIARTDDGGIITLTDFTGGHNWVMLAGQYGTARWTWNSDDSNLVIGLAGLDDSAGGEFEILDGSTIIGTVDTDNVCRTSYTGRGYTPMVSQPTLTDGAHTITIRPAGGKPATGNGPHLDYLGTMSKTPPLIVVMRPLPLPGPNYPLADAAAVQVYADSQRWEVSYANSQGCNVVICDATEGWDPATMIGPDKLHPSPRGHAHIADALCELLAGVGYSRGVTR